MFILLLQRKKACVNTEREWLPWLRDVFAEAGDEKLLPISNALYEADILSLEMIHEDNEIVRAELSQRGIRAILINSIIREVNHFFDSS